jgi:hypothetical protein
VSVSDLMPKLIRCGATRRVGKIHELRFNPKFISYIVRYAGPNRDRLTAVQGWRAILAGFHISLAMLSDDELGNACHTA